MNIPVFAGSAIAIFGAFMLKSAIDDYRRALASLGWPGVAGRLTDVRLWGKRRIGGEMKDVEKLVVEYRFRVNGIEYTGASATFHTLVYPETTAFAERYPVGSDVTVYHSPKDPSVSVLIPGPRKGKPYSDMILGCLGAAVGGVIAVLGWMGVIG